MGSGCYMGPLPTRPFAGADPEHRANRVSGDGSNLVPMGMSEHAEAVENCSRGNGRKRTALVLLLT